MADQAASYYFDGVYDTGIIGTCEAGDIRFKYVSNEALPHMSMVGRYKSSSN
jgi:hypothetical protein